jgi:hypothetical protein
MLIVGLDPLHLRKDRQRNVHGLNRKIDPDHLFRLQGSFGFDTQPQGTDIDTLSNLVERRVFSGEEPVPFQLDDLFKGLAGGQALFFFQGLSPFFPQFLNREFALIILDQRL